MKRTRNSVSEIFFLLATGALLMAVVSLIHQQHPLVANIMLYAFAVYVVFKALNEVLSFLRRVRNKDQE